MHLAPAVTRIGLALLIALAAPAIAAADPPSQASVAVDGVGDWPTAVATLQHDLAAQGRVLHVRVVRASGQPAVCGSYVLTLDAVASRAFEVGACDPETNATEVQLVHRDALFGPGEVVPTPLQPGISATYVGTANAAGGAASTGDTDVRCSLDLRPYLDDLEHGARVYLTPDRFDLHVIDTVVTAANTSDGWLLRGPRGAAMVVRYEIRDRATDAIVMQREVRLECQSAAAHDEPVSVASMPVMSDPTATPAPRQLRWTLDGVVTPLLLAYAPLGGQAFHFGQQILHGNDLGIDGEPMIGTGLIGFASTLGPVIFSVQPRVFVGEHFGMFDVDAAAGLSLGSATVQFRFGPMASLGWGGVYGFTGGAGTTNAMASLGAWAQLVFRHFRPSAPGERAHFVESGVAVVAPFMGQGAWSLAWTESWGTGR